MEFYEWFNRVKDKLKDVSDSAIFLDNNHEVICFKNEWIKRGEENICGCNRCNREREYEGLCKRCGECCRLKTYGNDDVKATNEYCQYLDWEFDGKAKCKVYGNKRRIGGKVAVGLVCVTAEVSGKNRDLPDDCPYVKDIPGYKSRVIWGDKGG